MGGVGWVRGVTRPAVCFYLHCVCTVGVPYRHFYNGKTAIKNMNIWMDVHTKKITEIYID